jgi:glucosylglycerate phosphorylase
MNPEDRIRRQLSYLFGDKLGEHINDQLRTHIEDFRLTHPQLANGKPLSELLTERDAILITYGDQLNQPGAAPLQTLSNFLNRHLSDIVSGVHLLPFYPYSSDDGFSVIDYRKVDPDLGDWDNIRQLGQNFRLMFDAVVNHISQKSDWFKGFLKGVEPFNNYFIVVEPDVDLSRVVRPRTHPLLTPFITSQGKKYVWTTFSEDQIDLNFKNPQVLVEITNLLLFYAGQGAEFIRLDAIAYLWKEIGTPSIHLPQTHAVVKLFRAVLDSAAPDVILITETNVPHKENITYYGEKLPGSDRTDEAQMVYQFPLAPLTVHTFISGSSNRLREWASGLDNSQPFFNFIASHDGIGMMPARGLLDNQEIQNIIDRTLQHGGQVSHKKNEDGSLSVYELNITLFDLLNDPRSPEIVTDVNRFLASQAVMLSLSGVPGIYFHSLFGSRSCSSCYEETGRARSLNREKFLLKDLDAELANPDSSAARVFSGYQHMLEVRRESPVFHPRGDQRILNMGDTIFGLLRTAPGGSEQVLCLISVVPGQQIIPKTAFLKEGLVSGDNLDLLSGLSVSLSDDVRIGGYQVLWLKLEM